MLKIIFFLFYIKLKILYFTQKISFKFSEGVIFLHKYSRNFILRKIGGIKGSNKIIAHGVKKFDKKKIYKQKKYRLIYVSNIDYYKNHLFLVKCLDEFIKNNPNYAKKLKVEFYGSNYPPALKKLNNFINNDIRYKKNFRYYGVKNSKFIYKEKKII